MSDVAALIADLVRAGVDPDLIGRVADALAGQPAMTARQERNRRYYERKASEKRLNSDDQDGEASESVLKRLNSDALAPFPPSLDKNPPPHPPKKLNPSPLTPQQSPREALLAVLDDERAGAVIEHRQRIRKPLTAHAAKLLAGKLAQAADPNSAADTMIANGWQGFEPAWLENRQHQARGSPLPKPMTPSQFADQLARSLEHDDAESADYLRLAGPVPSTERWGT